MCKIIGYSIKEEILRQVREAIIDCFMVDETPDLDHFDHSITHQLTLRSTRHVSKGVTEGATVIQNLPIGFL